MEEQSPSKHSSYSPHDWVELFKKAPCGYILTDPKGRILKVNDTLTQWIKYKRDEMEGRMRFQDLLSIGGKMFYETRHAPMLKLQDVNEVNYDFVIKGGERKTVLLNSARQLDDQGNIIAIQFIILPFSDRKKYERELLEAKKKSEEASAAKSMFLSTVSHEIRTPIHAILNAGEILLNSKTSPEQHELLELIHYSSHNLLELINSILDLNKMESGNISLKEVDFNLRDLLEQLYKIFWPQVHDKTVKFELLFPEQFPVTVKGDEGKLRQILTNLIGNAIKFTQKGKIELRLTLLNTTAEEHLIRFALMDTGIGMSEKEVLNIFDPFIQANNSIHQEFGGTGLGLTIAKNLLHFMGSDLKVNSKLNIGSTFSFDLRFKKSTQQEKNKPFADIPMPEESLSTVQILIVDDLFSNLIILQRYLNIWGIQYQYATSGKEAITNLKQKDYDLVFMDINMPEMDGYETTRRIRELPGEKFRHLPIIALSAYDATEIKYKVKRCGMNGFLQKPFKARQLYDIILKYKTPEKQLRPASPNHKTASLKTVTSYEPARDSLCDFFDHDSKAIKKYLKIALEDLEDVIRGFEKAEATYSLKSFRNAAHKTTSMISLFKLDPLKERMKKGKELLAAGDQATFSQCSKEIIHAFRQLSQWMQSIIQQEGDVCN